LSGTGFFACVDKKYRVIWIAGRTYCMKFSVVIPCYNEIATIESVFKKVRESPLEKRQIIVVDDASTDGTRELLQGQLKTNLSYMTEIKAKERLYAVVLVLRMEM
jgi:cellulose synthase/poly-beta-1,6-N-acetylglucosamine synthase-like glycosyltransferase